MLTNFALSPDFRRALGQGALVVFMLLVFSELVLDHGLTSQIALMAALGYLGGVAVVAIRRALTPTATDVWLLRWGFVPLWFAAQIGVRQAWSLMGRL